MTIEYLSRCCLCQTRGLPRTIRLIDEKLSRQALSLGYLGLVHDMATSLP